MSDIGKIQDALKQLAEKAVALMRITMDKNGVNEAPRANGKNTLVGSNLYNDIQISDIEMDMIQFTLADYYKYVAGEDDDGNQYEWGRRPNQTPPPFSVIQEWCLEKGITDDNSVMWAIVNGIAKNGIKARPLADDFWEQLDDYFDSWRDETIKILLEETDEFFSD